MRCQRSGHWVLREKRPSDSRSISAANSLSRPSGMPSWSQPCTLGGLIPTFFATAVGPPRMWMISVWDIDIPTIIGMPRTFVNRYTYVI